MSNTNEDPDKLCSVCSFDIGKTECGYKGILECEYKEKIARTRPIL